MNKNIKLDFDLYSNNFKVLEDDDDLTIAQVDLLHLGTNRNNTNISKECVEKSLPSIFNKPLIYRFNIPKLPSISTDVTEHARNKEQEDNTLIGGIIPESSPVEYVERNGKTYLRMVCVIYKLYQQNLIRILQSYNGNIKVSIEILVLDGNQDKDGILIINEFKFLSFCILSDSVEEGIEGSQLNVTKYSLDDYNKKYLEFTHHIEIPKEVKDTVNQGLKYREKSGYSGVDIDTSIANFLMSNQYISKSQFDSLKQYFSKFNGEVKENDSNYLSWLLHGGLASYSWMKGEDFGLAEQKEIFVSKDELGSKDALTIDKNKDSMSEGTWSDDGIRKECLMAKNWKEVCRAVFQKLMDGWEDGKEGSLGYPVMEKIGNKVVYNHKGLASARAYAVKNNETGVLASLRAIYKHLGLEWDDSDKNDNSDKKVNSKMDEKTKETEKVENAAKSGEDTEDEKAEKVDNSTSTDTDTTDNCDYKAEYTALKAKFDAMEQDMKKYQRKDEVEKMSVYLNQFAHCYSADELKNAQDSIEKANYEDFAKSVDEKVKAFALSLKNTKADKPTDDADKADDKDTPDDKKEDKKDIKKNSIDFSVSPFMPKATYDFSNKENAESLDEIIKNSNVKLKK